MTVQPIARRFGRAHLLPVLLMLVSVQPGLLPTAGEEDLARFQGDYRVEVYPEAFGFLVCDGKLCLKMGGVGGGGTPVPLTRRADGRFALSADHPNAFEFTVEEGEVIFTLWSGGASYRGYRAGAVTGDARQPADAQDGGVTRAEILAELRETETAIDSGTAGPAIRMRLAKLLMQAGQFQRAREMVLSLVSSPTEQAPVEAARTAADLEYLLGHYEAGESLYRNLVERTLSDPAAHAQALQGLMNTLYMSNQFLRAREIDLPEGVVLPKAAQMRAFDGPPYGIEWDPGKSVASLSFLKAEPLPLVTAWFQDTPVNLIFDTGADQIILDDGIAAKLGVRTLATSTGTFGGGLKARTSFGLIPKVRLGEVTLHNVPITMMPAERFSAVYQDAEITVGGFIGTAVLRQFLSTVDYAGRRLVFRQRTEENARALRAQWADRIEAEIPFVLSGTHLMMAAGSLNGREGLTLFVDSGLASEASVTVPPQTLRYLGIPEPERNAPGDSVGGGGGVWASGGFALSSVGLGGLVQKNGRGEYGALTPDFYLKNGFIVDGLISLRFLSRYPSWTLDFDRMVFTFHRMDGAEGDRSLRDDG